MDWNIWTIDYIRAISDLQSHARYQVRRLRYLTITLAGIALLTLLGISIHASYSTPAPQDLPWVTVKLSGWVLIAALLLFFSRITWNYSNVWLGREGMLEDFALALKLLGIGPHDPRTLSPEDVENLFKLIQSLKQLRRDFEGRLLEGPELPKLGLRQ